MPYLVILWCKGLIIGFAIAVPLGPVGIVCIRRTVAYGLKVGFLSGIGAASADALFGLIAGLGIASLSALFVQYTFPLSIAGAVCLFGLGMHIVYSQLAEVELHTSPLNVLASYSSTFLLTLSNPITLFACTALIAGMRVLIPSTHYMSAALFASGIFLGSTLWWLLLCGIVSGFRKKVSIDKLKILNKLLGIVIIICSLMLGTRAITARLKEQRCTPTTTAQEI